MPDIEKVIKGLESCSTNDVNDCDGCPYLGCTPDNYCFGNMAKDALSLLKAHEPVEPVFNAMVETDMSYWVCGACGAFIYGNAYPHMAKDNMPKYCGYCGRAVKWE